VTTPDIYNLIASVANRTERTGLERKSTGAHAVATNLLLWCRGVFRHALGSGRADRKRTTMMCEWADYIDSLKQQAGPTHAADDLTNKIAA
jgi:hypothetical protein